MHHYTEEDCGIARNTQDNAFITIGIIVLVLALIVKVILSLCFPDLNMEKFKQFIEDRLTEIHQTNSTSEQTYIPQKSPKIVQKSDSFSWKLAGAVQKNNFNLVKSAIANGANIKGKDTDDNEALVYVSHTTSPEIVQYLIDMGCDVNHKNKYINTPLMFAIREDNLPAVKILVQNGANITDTTRSGRTMLSFAKSQEMRDYLSSLNGISIPEIMTRAWWRNATLPAVKAQESELLKHVGSGQVLPLATANVSDLEIIQYLLDMGYDISQENSNGDFPLLTAASSNTNPQMISFLISKGANINQQSSITGMTPLMSAAYFQQNPEIFKTMLSAGADLNLRDKKGHIAADYAKQFNTPEIFGLLGGKDIFY